MLDDFLEPFFTDCDEATMALLVTIFEDGDQQKFDDYLKKVPDEATKKRLRDGFEQVKRAKGM